MSFYKAAKYMQDDLENELEYLGMTGLEQNLTDNLEETMDFFTNAGIKQWILTGDSLYTTLKIGR